MCTLSRVPQLQRGGLRAFVGLWVEMEERNPGPLHSEWGNNQAILTLTEPLPTEC